MKDKISIEELAKARLESATVPVPQGAFEAIQTKLGAVQTASTGIATGVGLSGTTSGLLAGALVSALLIGGSSSLQQLSSDDKVMSESQKTIEVISVEQSPNVEVVDEYQKVELSNEVSIESEKSKVVHTDFSLVESAEPEELEGSFDEVVEYTSTSEVVNDQISIQEAAEASFESSIQSNKVGGESPLEVEFNAPSNVTRAMWNAGDGSPKSEGLSYNHVYNKPGTYTVTMIAQRENGKVFQDQMVVTIADNISVSDTEINQEIRFDLPNVFTPNADGYNDEFEVSVDQSVELQLFIYNSAGRLVFQDRNQSITWNGKELDGTDAPTGTYFYQLKAVLTNGKVEVKKGSLTLTR